MDPWTAPVQIAWLECGPRIPDKRVSQRRPKAHDSSLEHRRIIEISNSNIETDIMNATTFILQYYQFDEVESSVTGVLNQLWRDYLEQFGKRAQEKKEIAIRSKKQFNMDSVLNRVLKETGMTKSSEGIFDLINWYQDEYSVSQIYKFNSNSEEPAQLPLANDFTTTSDENPELRTFSEDSKNESTSKRPKLELNGASEDIDDSIINEMVSNPLVGDLDTFVSNQNISSVTGHRKRQVRMDTVRIFELENLFRLMCYYHRLMMIVKTFFFLPNSDLDKLPILTF